MPILIALGMLCFVVAGAVVSAILAGLLTLMEAGAKAPREIRIRGRPATRPSRTPNVVQWQDVSPAEVREILDKVLGGWKKP